MFTVAKAIRSLGKRFGQAGLDSPMLCARMLVAKATGFSREKLAMYPETLLDTQTSDHLANLAARRLTGEPLAYILGQREFYGRDFLLDSSTLIPRPETELLLELALELNDLPSGPDILHSRGQAFPHTSSGHFSANSQNLAKINFLDAGTGSGCIGISLALERPDWHGILLDISRPALKIARKNAKACDCLNRLAILRADMAALPLPDQCLSLVVGNPPYIAASEMDDVMPDVLSFEPTEALFSPGHGLDHCRALANEAARVLQAGGWILLEHGASQGEAVRQILDRSGFCQIRTERDLAGLERCSLGQLPHSQ